MAFLSHLRPNNTSKKPITKRRTSRGTKVTKATPRVATITASVATAANVPTIALRQLTVIPATRTSVNASTNSTAAAINAAITIARCIYFFSSSLCRGLHQALPIGNDVCVISLLQFLKEALSLWNVHDIPPEAGPPIRSRLAHQALDLFQRTKRPGFTRGPLSGSV